MSDRASIDSPTIRTETERRRPPSRLRVFVLLSVFYLSTAAIATWPRAARMSDTLPTLADPAQHLTIMRWYRTCLRERRSPFRLSSLQYPVGATLGSFSPMLAQAALFIPLSAWLKNDCLTYNLLWFFGFWSTGMGSYYLIRRFVNDRAAAALGGLGVMLSGPLTAHAHGHLELMYLGSSALFLAAWIEFVESPTLSGLAGAVPAYWLTTACAAYNAVLCIAPAAWFVLVAGLSQSRATARGWWKRRLVWLSAFVATALPGLCLLFAGPIWSWSRGVTMQRSFEEFRWFGAPIWSLFVPPAQHLFPRVLGVDLYRDSNYSWIESETYLGVVALCLLARAAFARTRFRHDRYWWSCLAFLVVLSFGAELRFGGRSILMPGYWLWRIVPILRLIRVPARFNLGATLAAGVIVSAGLSELFARRRAGRRLWPAFALLWAITAADLGTLRFVSTPLPRMPACYRWIRDRQAEARLYEAPSYGSGFVEPLTACAGYWQGFHRLKTSAGYSGVPNDPFDARVGYHSPFDGRSLAHPRFLSDPAHVSFGTSENLDAQDALWLFMKANDFSHIVLHRWKGSGGENAPGGRRWERLIRQAKVYEDADALVFAAERLRPPVRPALTPTTGWFGAWPNRKRLFTRSRGDWAVVNPSPSRPVRFVWRGKSHAGPIVVRLLLNDVERAVWTIDDDRTTTRTGPPLSLSGSIDRLSLEVIDRRRGGLPLLEIVGARLENTEPIR